MRDLRWFLAAARVLEFDFCHLLLIGQDGVSPNHSTGQLLEYWRALGSIFSRLVSRVRRVLSGDVSPKLNIRVAADA